MKERIKAIFSIQNLSIKGESDEEFTQALAIKLCNFMKHYLEDNPNYDYEIVWTEVEYNERSIMHCGHIFFRTDGRISLKIWWLSNIAIWLLTAITIWVWHQFGFHDAIFGMVVTFIALWMRINVNIKRLHDRGKSGWWLLIFEAPIFATFLAFIGVGMKWWLLPLLAFGSLWGFIEMGCRRGEEGANTHGEPL